MFMMYPHYYNGGFSWFGLFPFFIILGVILFIWAITARRSDSSDEDAPVKQDNTALEILKKRYARGEITKREFLEMKKDIG